MGLHRGRLHATTTTTTTTTTTIATTTTTTARLAWVVACPSRVPRQHNTPASARNNATTK